MRPLVAQGHKCAIQSHACGPAPQVVGSIQGNLIFSLLCSRKEPPLDMPLGKKSNNHKRNIYEQQIS